MESYSSKYASLLTKFSNAVSLLVFFEDFLTGQKLMKLLGRDTNELWANNYKAFVVGFEFSRKKMKYFKYFDSEIAEWLLDGERYQKYELQLWAVTVESFEALIEFFEKVKNPEMLKIDYIKFGPTHKNAGSYIRLYEVMGETLSISNTEEILINQKHQEQLLYNHAPVTVEDDFASKIGEESDITKFPFIHTVNSKEDEPFVERVHTMSYIPETNFNCRIIRIKVSESLFDGKNGNSAKIKPSDPNQKLRICLIIPKNRSNVDHLGNRLKEIENSKEQVCGVDLEFKEFSMEKFADISATNCQLIQNLKFGSKQDDIGTLVKPYIKFLFKSNDKLYLVSAKKSEFQYIEKSLIFGNDNVLVFKNLAYLDLEDVRIVENDTNNPVFNTLKGIEGNMGPFLKKFSSLMILQNKKFEQILMHHKSNGIYPTPKCKTVKIMLQSNSRKSIFKSFGDFIDLIPKDCKVHLIIKISSDITERFLEVANSILKMCKITKLSIKSIYTTTSFYLLIKSGLNALMYLKSIDALEEIGYESKYISRKFTSDINEMQEHIMELMRNSLSNYNVGNYMKKKMEILDKDLIDIFD